jgi:aspartyl-tRNA(Asn)/glutamyl-tRNA(Gln) amidotransferase subunit A
MLTTPVALKDNISVKGIETTCGLKMLTGYVPVFNAAVVEKLEQAGVTISGKFNIDGMSPNSPPLALYTDADGELRRHCATLGATGIKPTYAAVSRYGLISFTSSLDQIGVIGKNIDDCAAVLAIISGADDRDGTCVLEKPFNFEGSASEKLQCKIGLPRSYLDSLDEGERTAILAAAKEFEAAGAVIEDFNMPLADYIFPAYYIIACAETSSNLAKFDGLKFGYHSKAAKSLADVYRLSRSEGFEPEVKKRIMFGSLVLSSGCYDVYYRKAMQVRSLVREFYKSLFERFDFILTPAEKSNEGVFNLSTSLAGLPAVVLPCGAGGQGAPAGLQLIGNAFTEEKLVTAARVFQKRIGEAS